MHMHMASHVHVHVSEWAAERWPDFLTHGLPRRPARQGRGFSGPEDRDVTRFVCAPASAGVCPATSMIGAGNIN